MQIMACRVQSVPLCKLTQHPSDLKVHSVYRVDGCSNRQERSASVSTALNNTHRRNATQDTSSKDRPTQGETQNVDKPSWLIKIILYYEVPQNALCSLCLHHLNSGSKRKTQEVLPVQQRARPSEIRCVRYRYTAVKTSQSKDSLQTLPIND